MIREESNREIFLYKKSYLKKRLQHDVMENGIAYIPCKVGGIDDIISKYSVKGCESLDSEFMAYIIEFVNFIPANYPVVLEIYGPEFSPEEKKVITETIMSDMDYRLGKTEEENHYRKKKFVFLTVGTILSGILLGILKKIIKDVPLEFFFVLFWLFADSLTRYVFIEKPDFREEKIRAGRLASMEVEFVEQSEAAGARP